jgi:hypothetical protein
LEREDNGFQEVVRERGDGGDNCWTITVANETEGSETRCLHMPRNTKAMIANLYAAWIGFLLGCVAGAIPGLFFHREGWLGGYASWSRRMVRLAHIAFFGIGFLNLAFALTSRSLSLESSLVVPSTLLIIGALTMPLVCYLSIWKISFRHLFFIPVLSITLGIVIFLWRLVSI